MQAGITQQDLQATFRSRILPFDGLNVLAQEHLLYSLLLQMLGETARMLHLKGVTADRLYYTDSYLGSFEAPVAERGDDGRRIYLERTAFYPSSGGQPNDLGTLAGQPVIDVIDEEDRIAHVMAAPVWGDVVEGCIDWQRRYQHMQQHTGQHLLSAFFAELLGFETLSFHMGSEVSTIELGAKSFSESQLEAVEERANEIIREARPVSVHFEEAEAVQGLRKASARTGTLRVIEISGLDRSACGGTHVRSTAEVAPLQIRKLEKVRGNVRLEFVCGTRAVRRAKRDFRILAELAKAGAVPMDELPVYFSTVSVRLAEAEKERQKSALELARREGEDLHRATMPCVDGLRRRLLRVPRIDENVRATVQAFTSAGRAVVLVVASEQGGMLVASSADSGVNAGVVLKQVLQTAGGRGGGSATLAQGSAPDETAVELLATALGFVKS